MWSFQPACDEKNGVSDLRCLAAMPHLASSMNVMQIVWPIRSRPCNCKVHSSFEHATDSEQCVVLNLKILWDFTKARNCSVWVFWTERGTEATRRLHQAWKSSSDLCQCHNVTLWVNVVLRDWIPRFDVVNTCKRHSFYETRMAAINGMLRILGFLSSRFYWNLKCAKFKLRHAWRMLFILQAVRLTDRGVWRKASEKP